MDITTITDYFTQVSKNLSLKNMYFYLHSSNWNIGFRKTKDKKKNQQNEQMFIRQTTYSHYLKDLQGHNAVILWKQFIVKEKLSCWSLRQWLSIVKLDVDKRIKWSNRYEGILKAVNHVRRERNFIRNHLFLTSAIAILW